MDEYLWDDATVTYPDWTGTAQLDRRITAPSIGSVVGLDPGEWLVIGFEIGGGEHAHRLKVVAVRRSDVPEGGDILPSIAEANGGEIPATEFLVHDVDPYAVLKAITHQFKLRMRARGTGDLPIRIVALGDVPEQDRAR